MKTNSVRATAIAAVVVLWCTSPAWSQRGIPANAINNANHYRDRGLGPATGRSGNATLNARALLAKDGTTKIELTTGALDTTTPTPPGNLDKVQYKPLDTTGAAIDAQNFNGLTGGGYYTFTTNELGRKQQLQLQSNISGIDKRTDVVTLTETVKLRPDLAVINLTNPASAHINEPVTIAATVVEQNTDTGATSDCALYVDGSNVDAAHHIWVDAGGNVTCTFNYKFPSTGTHSLQVTAANVVPADWDTSNNSATGSISIVNPTTALSFYGSFIDQTFSSYNFYGYTDAYNGTVYSQYQDTDTSNGWVQQGYVEFWNYKSSNIQYPVQSAAWTETMDGTVTASVTGSVPYQYSYQYANGYGGTTTFAESWGNLSADVFVTVDSESDMDSVGNTVNSFDQGYAYRWAGDVTYYSTGFSCNVFYAGVGCQPGDYYSWNVTSHSIGGTRYPVGSQWAVKFSMTDNAGVVWGAALNVNLTNTTASYGTSTPTTITWGPDSSGFSGTDSGANWSTYNQTYGQTTQ